MKPSETDPQTIATDEHKTMELCGNEHHGSRCILRCGHRGRHESHATGYFLSWLSDVVARPT
jgi:hypothetical protein